MILIFNDCCSNTATAYMHVYCMYMLLSLVDNGVFLGTEKHVRNRPVRKSSQRATALLNNGFDDSTTCDIDELYAKNAVKACVSSEYIEQPADKITQSPIADLQVTTPKVFPQKSSPGSTIKKKRGRPKMDPALKKSRSSKAILLPDGQIRVKRKYVRKKPYVSRNKLNALKQKVENEGQVAEEKGESNTEQLENYDLNQNQEPHLTNKHIDNVSTGDTFKISQHKTLKETNSMELDENGEHYFLLFLLVKSYLVPLTNILFLFRFVLLLLNN